MAMLPASELILTSDGRIYHLDLAPEEIPDTILTVGDPGRVGMVSQYFDALYFKRTHREFVAHRGRVGHREVLVISTGMGTDNIEILMTELDALVNVDFTQRLVKEQHTSLKIIRIGTSGSLQPEIAPGSLIASSAGIGLDTLMEFYSLTMEHEEQALCTHLQQSLMLGFTPYMATGDVTLVPGLEEGVTITCPGFYAPQGRTIRLKPKVADLPDRLMKFRYKTIRFSNFEMETAGMYAMGKMLGHQMLSTNAIIANRMTGTFAANPQVIVDNLITKVIESL
jgi:uridine phosphorylase